MAESAQVNISKFRGLRLGRILVKMGEMKTIGGQEDLIEDVALDLAKAKNSL